MEEAIKKPSSEVNKKEKTSWTKTIEKGDKRKTYRVKEAENGWIIECDYSYKDENGEYQYEELLYISKENPIKNDPTFKKEDKTSLESYFGDIEL